MLGGLAPELAVWVRQRTTRKLEELMHNLEDEDDDENEDEDDYVSPLRGQASDLEWQPPEEPTPPARADEGHR
jgi:hypothetical protein